MPRKRLVFVYGTLLTKEPNHRLLIRARLVGRARTKPGFELHHLGGFPGMVRGGDGVVVGEVFEVDAPTLAALDRLEGHPRFYRRTSIVLDGGAAAEAYLLRPDQVEGRPVIVSGDWRRRSR